MNDFEEQLKATPMRRVPPAWRAEILAAAREGEAPAGSTFPAISEPIPFPEPARPSKPWWTAWLWPSPVAWAAVVCAWLVIFGLDYASGPSRSETAALASIPPGVIENALIQQQQIVQELFRSGSEPTVPPRRREDSPGACNGYATRTRTELV